MFYFSDKKRSLDLYVDDDLASSVRLLFFGIPILTHMFVVM